MLQNESKFIVKYEVYIYKGASVGKIDAAIGTGVFEGRTALEIIQAEGLNPEEGRIPVGGTAYVTCGYGGKIAIRYFFEDLHADYTDELRNFQVLDVIKFLQPFKIQLSPSFIAVVAIPPASEPVLCSVKPQAPIHSPVANLGNHLSFCN